MNGIEATLIWGFTLVVGCWFFALVALARGNDDWAIEAGKASILFLIFFLVLIGFPIYFPRS